MIQKVHSLTGYLSSLSTTWQEIISQALKDVGIDQLSSLEDFHQVKEIDCSRTDIEDLYPLRMFPYLEVLDISGTQIKNVCSLMYLAELRELHACFCPPFDLDILITLPKLEILDISYPKAPLEKLAALSDLEQLKEGYFNACCIPTVAHFMTMEKLDILSLPFNPIPKDEVLAYRDIFPKAKVIF